MLAAGQNHGRSAGLECELKLSPLLTFAVARNHQCCKALKWADGRFCSVARVQLDGDGEIRALSAVVVHNPNAAVFGQQRAGLTWSHLLRQSAKVYSTP